jgi:hypothetical protein
MLVRARFETRDWRLVKAELPRFAKPPGSGYGEKTQIKGARKSKLAKGGLSYDPPGAIDRPIHENY